MAATARSLTAPVTRCGTIHSVSSPFAARQTPMSHGPGGMQRRVCRVMYRSRLSLTVARRVLETGWLAPSRQFPLVGDVLY